MLDIRRLVTVMPSCRQEATSKLNNTSEIRPSYQGPSYVTLTFPLLAARRLMVTTSHRFYELHTSIHSVSVQ